LIAPLQKEENCSFWKAWRWENSIVKRIIRKLPQNTRVTLVFCRSRRTNKRRYDLWLEIAETKVLDKTVMVFGSNE